MMFFVTVKDNYLRFYLKHIAPMRDKIRTGAKEIKSLAEIKNMKATLGFQFENLILANRSTLYPFLGLTSNEIHSSAPYTQKKKVKNKGACQVDLLIHTFLGVFFLCEFKCKKTIDQSIIQEVQKKMDVLVLPKRSAIKPVLVYAGDLNPNHQDALESFFYRLISLEHLLQGYSTQEFLMTRLTQPAERG